MTWTEVLNGFCLLEIFGLIFLRQKVVFTVLYPNRQADGHLNSCCPQSIAFGASGIPTRTG